MNLAKEPVVSEEPLPGWLRFEPEGGRVWFKSPVPRTVIRDASMLKRFLEKEHSQNRMLDVDGSEFSFKRRLGLRQTRTSPVSPLPEGHDDEVSEHEDHSSTVVERLTRNTEVVNHKKPLQNRG